MSARPRNPAGTAPKAGGRRVKARQERYDAVFAAAIALFIERGYDGTTMEAIADRAGVARASVFNYFPRKQAILAEWAVRRRRSVRELIGARQIAERPVGTVLYAYMDAWADVNERMREETVACGLAALRDTDLLTNSGLSDELEAYLSAALSRGELRPGLDVRQGGLLLAAAYFAVIGQWIASDPAQYDLHRELRKLTELFLEGMLAHAPGTVRASSRRSSPA